MKSVAAFLAVSVPLLLLTGCPDAEGEYEAFKERFSKIDSGAVVNCDAPIPCTAIPQPGEIDGDYFFAFASSLEKTKPMVFVATITTSAGAAGTDMHWSLQALDWSDRVTPVGPAIDAGTISIAADGTIDADLPPIDVVGAANPFSHTDITADVSSLTGQFCAGQTFFYGDFDGTVTKPITLSVDGSTWTLTKVTGPADYPEPPPTDCQQTPALPVGTWQ
jgi:hypothetical protein